MAYTIKKLKCFDSTIKDVFPKKFKYTDINNVEHITNLRSDIPDDATVIYESTKISEWNYDLIKYE